MNIKIDHIQTYMHACIHKYITCGVIYFVKMNFLCLSFLWVRCGEWVSTFLYSEDHDFILKTDG